MDSYNQKPAHASHQTIDDVDITFGSNPDNDYNLSILKARPYQVAANGYYDKTKPILSPLEWIKSSEGQKHISKLYSKIDTIILLASYRPLVIYTSSRYVWLGYLKHCIGDIDTAIGTELA